MKKAIGAVVAVATVGGLGYMAYRRYMPKVVDFVKGMKDANNSQVIHLGHDKE
ncbi:hypothetical protein D3C87_970300 [compost metagenome]